MRVYLILCDGKVSCEGYALYEDAKKFVESRKPTPKCTGVWNYEDAEGRHYEITDILVRS